MAELVPTVINDATALQSAQTKWEFMQEAMNVYNGIIENMKQTGKQLFAVNCLRDITEHVKRHARDLSREEMHHLEKINNISSEASIATHRGNDLVRRIDTIVNNLLRIMSRSREPKYLETAFNVFRRELESLLPEIDSVNKDLLKFSEKVKETNSSVRFLKDAVQSAIHDLEMKCRSDCAKTRGKNYGIAMGITAVVGIICLLIPELGVAYGVAKMVGTAATASFGSAVITTEFFSIPDIVKQYKTAGKKLDDLIVAFEAMEKNTCHIADKMEQNRKSLVEIKEGLYSADINAKNAYEERDMFDMFYDHLKEDLEKAKELCKRYLQEC